MKRFMLFLLVLFAVVLAGCGPEAEEFVPTALPASTDASTVQQTIMPAATNTSMPSAPTEMPEPVPAATERPPDEPALVAALECVAGCQTAFSFDSKTIAIGKDTVQLWSIPEFELTQEFVLQNPQSNYSEVINMVFSTDGELLAAVFGEYYSKESRLLVWDIAIGQLVFEMDLEKAVMVYQDHKPYEYLVEAMAFIPDSSRLIYANGNDVEIRDVLDAETPPDVLDLDDAMFASQIEVREDGEFVCVFMDWKKNHTYQTETRTKYHGQVWHLYSQNLRMDIPFPDMDPVEEGMYLAGPILLQRKVIDGTLEGKDLYTNIEYKFPFRGGINTLSPDATRMVVFRSNWSMPEDEKGLEIWDTYHGEKLYDFRPAYHTDTFYFRYGARFSPNNKYLAMVYYDACYIWDLMPDIEADLYKSD